MTDYISTLEEKHLRDNGDISLITNLEVLSRHSNMLKGIMKSCDISRLLTENRILSSQGSSAVLASRDNEHQFKSIFSIDQSNPFLIHHSFIDSNAFKKLTQPYLNSKRIFNQLLKGGANIIETTISVENISFTRDAINIGFEFCGIINEGPGNTKQANLAVFHLTNIKSEGTEGFPLLPDAGITDNVVTLRPTLPEDYFGLYEEQKSNNFWSLFPIKSLDEIKKNALQAKLKWITSGLMTVSIIENNSNSFIGKMNLRPVIPPKVADVGYGILPCYQGKGYASRALRLFTHWVFSSAGYTRIELGIKEGNEASQYVALACGYKFETVGQCRLANHDGSFVNQLGYAKINPNFFKHDSLWRNDSHE